MPVDENYSDLPIVSPEQDTFGIDNFVISLAKSIRMMKTPRGAVVGLNGPWGSGKSSAINLLTHHLKEAADHGEIALVPFNPWWFRGEEALVLAFFQELYTATNPDLPEQAKKLLPKLGAKLLKAGGMVAAAADVVGASGAGALASGAMGWLSGLIEDGDSVEKLHKELASALAAQQKRFVVLIDDIDRLAPDEALAMFRLVKSVGRLPNVIYIVAFDRALAEKLIAERFPSEGPHYLEKIVQVSFELPVPDEVDLRDQLLGHIFEICGDIDESLSVDFMNIFQSVVLPEMSTPRDVTRFVSSLSLTWPAVAGEVHLADFLAIETYRIFQPSIYRAIRDNSERVCGVADPFTRQREQGDQLDRALLLSVEDKVRHRRGLMRLFPRLSGVWANTVYGHDQAWSRLRRICAKEHFPTYFRLSLNDGVVSIHEIRQIIERCGDRIYIQETLRAALQTKRRNGGTKAATLLETLNNHAAEIPVEASEDFLRVLFEIADELDVEADHGKAFSIGSNNFRLHWLLRSLLFERTTLEQRSGILLRATETASLGWLVDIATSGWTDYHPRDGKLPEEPDRCLFTSADAEIMKIRTLEAFEAAAADGALLVHRSLGYLIYRWFNFTEDGGAAVRSWTDRMLDDDRAVALLANAFTSVSWSQGFGFHGEGDVIARRSDHAQVNGLEEILDKVRFRRRLEALAAANSLPDVEMQMVNRFSDAWCAEEARLERRDQVDVVSP